MTPSFAILCLTSLLESLGPLLRPFLISTVPRLQLGCIRQETLLMGESECLALHEAILDHIWSCQVYSKSRKS